jgi:hypothetical protein
VAADPDLTGIHNVRDLGSERLPFGIGDIGQPHAAGRERDGALIGLLGMPIGELWNLDALAAGTADRRWSFLLTMAPLSLGGVGSPANAIALR